MVGIGRHGKGELMKILSLKEASDARALICWDCRQDLGRAVHVAPKDSRLVIDDGDGERVWVDVDILVGKEEPTLSRDVAEQVHRLVKVVDDVRLVTNQVAELVARRRVDEAIANPLARLDAIGKSGQRRSAEVSSITSLARNAHVRYLGYELEGLFYTFVCNLGARLKRSIIGGPVKAEEVERVLARDGDECAVGRP